MSGSCRSDAGGDVITVLRAAERASVPWKNGLGSTSVVASAPSTARGVPGAASDFDWRVSIADESAGAVFSAFPGVDRLLTPVTSGGFSVLREGGVVRLGDRSILEFSGEDAVEAGPDADGRVALNLMLRRGAWSGSVTWVDLAPDPGSGMRVSASPTTLSLVVVVAGALALEYGAVTTALGPLDAILVESAGSGADETVASLTAVITGRGTVVRCDLDPVG